MRFCLTTLLVVILWASLGLLGYRNIERTIEISPQIAALEESFQRQDDFARQQIQLSEFALAGKRDSSTMEMAEEKLREIQQRYGQLRIVDPNAVAIVTIPDVVLRERQAYAWRVYVPRDQQVELAAFVGDDDSESSNAQRDSRPSFTPDRFRRALPAGESIVKVEWREHYFGKWGSFDTAGRSPPTITVTINTDEFRWESTCLHSFTFIRPTTFRSQQTLFGAEETAKLLGVSGMRSDFQLVLRQSTYVRAGNE